MCCAIGKADEYDWPRWRGPLADGSSRETEWNPEALAGGPKVLWSANVGIGHSSVVIQDDYLYTMGQEKGDTIVFCLDAETGEEIWRYAIEDYQDPQSTPTVEGKYVYVLSKGGLLLCLKAKNGKLQWQKDLVSDYDVVKPFYGFAGSPAIEGDLLLLTANTWGIALNKKTGEKVWCSDKPPEDLRLSFSTGTHYATPVVYDDEGKRYAIITSYAGVHAVEVETGKVHWVYRWDPDRNIHVSDPLYFDGKVFIAQYDGRGSVLLDIGGGEPKVVWKNEHMSSDNSSPVLIDGYIYGVDGGIEVHHALLQCLDVETGELMWEEDPDTKSISLMTADGKIILIEEKGTLRISEATPSSYTEISSGNVLGEEPMIT
jgi:outer membrane protein assembly factor BamB